MIKIGKTWSSQLSYLKTMTTFKIFSIEITNFKNGFPSPMLPTSGMKWKISISNSVQTLHFQEIIKDEDGFYDEGKLLFIGELS